MLYLLSSSTLHFILYMSIDYIYAFVEGEQINLSFNLWVVINKKREIVKSSGFDDLTSQVKRG